MTQVLDNPLLFALAALLLIIGSARITRLVTGDSYPPSVKLRIWWSNHVNEMWEPLMKCPWCFAPYAVAVNMLAAWLSDMHPAWWIINGWLTAAYAASYVVFHDED